MAASTCALAGLYNIICRDPETATGGLDPVDVDLHAPGFYRSEREELEFLTGQSIDRRVRIEYDGTSGWPTLFNPVVGATMRTFLVTIRVGYFVGDHGPESFIVMAEDGSQIVNAISRSGNWPQCVSGCVNGYVPLDSNLVRIDSTRYTWDIVVSVTVTG